MVVSGGGGSGSGGGGGGGSGSSSGGGGCRVIQVTNIAPQATKDQMATLFGYLGRVDDIRLYPTVRDVSCPVSSRVCWVRYAEPAAAAIAPHLTNTVFIDRALIVVGVPGCSELPDEHRALRLSAGGALPGGPPAPRPEPRLPSHLVNTLDGASPNRAIRTHDPRLAEAGLPPYPPLPASCDARRIEEIRRTLLVVGLDANASAQRLVDRFGSAGRVEYARFCERESDGSRCALIEFAEQESVVDGLRLNGTELDGRTIEVHHATQAITKPQTKSNEAAQREIEEAMCRVKEAQNLISAAIDPVIGLLSKDKRRSRSRSRSGRRSRSRQRSRRSRSRSRRRSRRSRSRSRHRSRRSRSRSRRRRRRSRSRSGRRRSRERRSRSRGKGSRPKREPSKNREREREKEKEKDREREKRKEEKPESTERETAVEKRSESKEPPGEKRASRSREKKSRERKRSRSRDADRERKRSRSREKRERRSRSRAKRRSRSRDRERKRSRSRDAKRSRSRGRKRSRSRERRKSGSRERKRSRSGDRKRSTEKDPRTKSPEAEAKARDPPEAVRDRDGEERGFEADAASGKSEEFNATPDARSKDSPDNMDISNSP